ncbi:kinase-like protein [Aaosphaeria arxii CBS 175.79]|uniref:Kinase-like protein n=1 Tax=Aaosphaeria arxii CBS 175.79 TaxID=1450172 RepID=A0A6A5Y9K8_9PLEO|nr:kinase-like protein [Aaosphaeria arxii CBS 175.79]KAF2022275.1 kinase-like protein [Aaosphaeria arxii CBS 175.79]
MPRPYPHEHALFSLRPYNGNELARRIIDHPNNSHNVSLCDGIPALDVGFHLRRNSSSTLAELGRHQHADIYLDGAHFSRTQCSFEIVVDTGVIMLHDRSSGGTTQCHASDGDDAAPFQYGRAQRKVLVQKDFNTVIGMGGTWNDLLQFELEWHRTPAETAEAIRKYNAQGYDVVENPRLATTRPATPPGRSAPIRCLRVHKLGSGSFGTVHKAIDVDSGEAMAVKTIKRPTGEQQQAKWEKMLEREVEILRKTKHSHIVEYIWAQVQGTGVAIFMSLKEGNLQSLIERGDHKPGIIADSVLPQMLQALDCIASNRIVHRDVKPENILYVTDRNDQSGFRFQLGDFGFAKSIADPASVAGTYIFMPPELFQGGSNTTKLDVWSLFVTMMWTLDTQGFRQNQNYYQSQPATVVQGLVRLVASPGGELSRIQRMAMFDPDHRASAAEMLVDLFPGIPLSNPQHAVPHTPIAPVEAPNPAPYALTPPVTRSKTREMQRNAAAAQHHVE